MSKLSDIAEGVLVCLRYPRGSEAQIRCLEELGNDVQSALKSTPEEMPLRTYLAGQAMVGLLANPKYWKMMLKDSLRFSPECIAIDSVETADALIAELNKESKS